MLKTARAPLPPEDAEALLERSRAAGADLRYACTLVTPMYGGGVKAGEVDTDMPIRATAIRGQLREWWRRLNRKNFKDDKAMFAAERAIWGGLGDAETLAASKVVVRVESAQAGSLKPVGKYEKNKKGNDVFRFDKNLEDAGYALFPAAPNNENAKIGELVPDGHSFTLLLGRGAGNTALTNEQWRQLQDAVRWWATFGGVGARTRRGCGAVQVKDAKGKLLSVSEGEVQGLGFRLVLSGSASDAVAAWKYAIEKLKDFRQKPGDGRNAKKETDRKGKPLPGRSFWPEPDAIRRVTGNRGDNHKTPFCDVGDVFPRAAFGLPIVFQFKQEKFWRDRDPEGAIILKPVLNPGGKDEKTADRMASPLILRPYTTDGKRWRAAALCLDVGHIRDMGLSLELNGKNIKSLPAGTWQPTGNDIGKIKPLAGKASAIEAFFDFFLKETSAGGIGKPSNVPPQRPAGVVPVENLKLTLSSRNGALTAQVVKSNRQYTASGDSAKKLLLSLPEETVRLLEQGKYVFCDIDADQKDIVAVRVRSAP